MSKKTQKTNGNFQINLPLCFFTVLSVFACLFISILSNKGILYTKITASPETSVNGYFTAMINKDYDSASEYLSDINKIQIDNDLSSQYSGLYYDLLSKSFRYKLEGEPSINGLQATQTVSFTFFDLTNLKPLIANYTENILTSYSESLSTEELYDSEGHYLNSILEKGYTNALTDAVTDISNDVTLFNTYLTTLTFDIKLVYQKGHWSILTDDALVRGFTGNIGNSNIVNKKLVISTGTNTLSENDKIEVLNDYYSDVHEIRKHYQIGNTVPKPNPANFVTLPYSEAYKVYDVIEKARNCGLLAKDEQVIFSTEVNFLEKGYIHYYFDETILVIMWKELINGNYMSFSEIKVGDVSQFRRKIADDTYGSSGQYYCSQLNSQVNSVVCMNADFYTFRNLGITVYNGEVHRVNGSLDTLFIDGNGDFKYYERGEELSKESIQKFVDDNNVNFSLSFGPVMIKDHQKLDVTRYPIGENNEPYARTCFCQVDTLHYLYANSGYLSSGISGCTATDLTNFVYDKGVKEAYMLDGGQTSEIIFNGEIFNFLKYGNERTVSDMMYFATALPED